MNRRLIEKIHKGKVYAIIPARSGSKGIVDKNIKFLNGVPLLAYSIAAGKLSKEINRVIVSTDSVKYAEISKAYHAEVPFIRPPQFATDDSRDIDFMKHAIEWMAEFEDVIPEYWVHLRPTCPYRIPSVIDEAILKIKAAPQASSLLSICVPEGVLTPYKWMIRDGEYIKSIFFEKNDDANLPRQSYPQAYSRSIYVDILKSDTIINSDVLFGQKIIPFETKGVVDIDTLQDFETVVNINFDCEDLLNYLRGIRHEF